jgi:hypothetical protein
MVLLSRKMRRRAVPLGGAPPRHMSRLSAKAAGIGALYHISLHLSTYFGKEIIFLPCRSKALVPLFIFMLSN